MKDYTCLKILDRFSRIFKRLGVDYNVMRKILQVKLTLDNRKKSNIMNNSSKIEEEQNSLGKLYFTYILIGIPIMFFILMPISIYGKMTYIIAVIMFMVMSTMISDYSSVLLDTIGKNILSSKPINYRTINTAKVLHILIYISMITLSLSLPTLIAGSIIYSIKFPIIFVIDLILMSGFIVFLTSIIYSIILRFFDGEKLKDIINYFQIMITIVLIVGFQLGSHVINIVGDKASINMGLWNIFIPSSWFGSHFAIFIEREINNTLIILAIASIVIPVLAIVLHIKVTMPYFEKNIYKLTTSQSKEVSKLNIKEKIKGFIVNIICRERAERASFNLTSSMFKSERKLKLKIYPTIALSIIFPFIFMMSFFRQSISMSEILQSIINTKCYLYLYFSIVMIGELSVYISLSENYKGAWIYKILPIKSNELLIKGALKSCIVNYFIPVWLIESLLFLSIYGFRILPSLVLIFIHGLLVTLLLFKLANIEYPFSESIDTYKKSSATNVFLSFFIVGVLGAIHYGLIRTLYPMIGFFIISIIGLIYMWNVIFKEDKKSKDLIQMEKRESI